LQQGGIKINGEKLEQENIMLSEGMVIQIGKRRFARIIIE
jgi:tyrosyl-tRNA synthetase